MISGKPQHVVCEVRGRPQSQDTISSATDLAIRSGCRLTFFHAVSPGCLDCGEVTRSSSASSEYLENAESAMVALSPQARRRGLLDVDYILRVGETRQELRQLAVEKCAELPVLGYPNLDSTDSTFGREEFHQFLEELDLGGDLRTIRVKPMSGNEA